MEVSGQPHAPAALPLGKEPPVAIGQEAGRIPESVWALWRILKTCTPGNQTRDVQLIARRYPPRLEDPNVLPKLL
jgi:hypothetical protein